MEPGPGKVGRRSALEGEQLSLRRGDNQLPSTRRWERQAGLWGTLIHRPLTIEEVWVTSGSREGMHDFKCTAIQWTGFGPTTPVLQNQIHIHGVSGPKTQRVSPYPSPRVSLQRREVLRSTAEPWDQNRGKRPPETWLWLALKLRN